MEKKDENSKREINKIGKVKHDMEWEERMDR
jgi:hypothetical protein